MAATFVRITLAVMTEALEALKFEYTPDPKSGEYVFQKYIDRNGKEYTLRLYTGVDKHTDTSRDCGEDAIRLVVLCEGTLYGEGRVNRTTNWQANMKKRIGTWDQLFNLCPQCGYTLSLKKGKYGMFYGCSSFPKCGYTAKKV